MTTIIMISNDSSVIINPTTNEDEEKCKVEKSKSEEKRRRDRVEKDGEDDDGDGDGEEEEDDDDDECNDVISPPFSSPDSPSSNNSIGSPPPSDTSSFISSKGGKNQGGRKSQTQKLLNNRRRYKTSLSTLESDSEDLNHSSSSSGTSTLNSGASLNLVHGAVPSIPSDLFLTSLDDNYISALKANAIIKPPRKSSSTPVVRTRSFSQPTQKAPSSQSSSSVKISSGPSGPKSLGSIKEVINSPSSGPHGLRFYINHPSCNSQVTALSRSDCSSNTITYDTKSLGRKHHCRPSEEKCSSLIAIGNRPLSSAINTNGLPNVSSYCTLIRSRTPKPKSRCHVQALPSVPDQNEDNPRSDEVSSCESNQSLFQQTGTRIKLSVSSGTSQKGHLESSQPSSLNNSCPRSEPEPASFSIYSDINDFKELFTSTNDGIGANVEKDIFKHHQLQKPLASIISNSVFWADSEDELIESQVEEPDIDNFTSDDDQLSEIAAARRLGNDCVGVLPTGCHRHPHHASLPPPRLRLDQDIDDDDEGEYQTKGAETDGYLSSLLQDDWSKQTESDAIANRGFPGNATGLFTSLGALWEDVEVQRQRNLRHRSKSSQRKLSPDMGRKLPGLKSGFNLAKSMDGLLLRDPSFAKPSSGSDVRAKGGGGITSNVKRFSSALSGLNLAANSKILRRHTTYVKGPKSGVSTIPTTTTTTTTSTASPTASNYHSERTHVSPWQSSTIERLQTLYQTPHVHSWHRNRITDRKGEELFANGKNEKLGWSSRGSSVRKHLVRRSLSSSKIDQLGQDSEETSWPPTSKTRVKGENKENDVVITDELDENSSQNGSLASDRGVDIGRVGMWATDFEKLLHDPVGLQTFTEFLKKEFSAENIFFWVACERYRHLENESERHTAAIQIMDRHLSAGAPDPVNVDSHARQAAQDGMATTTPTMFNLAQKQIYNLMKFDSFSRFLKSELYKESLLAEMSGNPLPFANDLEAPLTEKGGEESKGSSKEKSSLSWGKKSSKADVENRRRSLLPWGNLRGKDRSKSKERSVGESELRAAKSMTLVPSQGQHKLKAKSRDDLSQSSRASLTSADVSKLSNNSRDSSLSHNTDCEGCTLARVILPDKATTVVQTRNQETIRAMVSRLLDKRGLKYTSFDVFAPNLDKPLDLSEDCSTLGCTEVRVEPRVLFRLELPSKKSIGVKAKPAKIVKDVLGPILSQYGWNLDEMRVKLDSSRIDIDLEDTVQSIDNSRLVVTGRMPTEEVNSRLFEDMMRSKRPHNNGLDDQRSIRTDSSTESSTRIYKKVPGGDTEKQSMPPPERIPMKRGGGSAFAKPKNANGPPSSAAILKNTGVTEELYEGLKLAQRGRLDDQRGTEINFEMPDFLKRGDANPRPNQDKENSHPFQSPLSHRQSEPIISNHRLDVFPPDPRLSTMSSNNFYSQIENDYHTLNHPNHPSPFGRPPRDSFYVHNRSNDSNFSQEGYLPNSSEADRFFNLSNHSGEFSSGQFNESRVSLGFGNTPYRRGASTQPHHSLPPQSLEPPQNLYETLSHYKSGWNTPGSSLPPMADPTMLMRREPPPLPPKPKFGRMGRPNGVSSEIDMPMHQAPQHQQQQQQQQQPRGYSVSFV